MWNQMDSRRFVYCEFPQWYSSYNYYDRFRPQNVFGRNHYSQYYDYMHWNRNQSSRYADVPYRRSHHQTTIPQSYNSKCTINERPVDSTWNRFQGPARRNTVHHNLVSQNLKDDVNSKTSLPSQNQPASEYSCQTNVQASFASPKDRNENLNLHALKTRATIVTFNVGMNGHMGSHFGATETVNKFLPVYVKSSMQHGIEKEFVGQFSLLKATSAEENSDKYCQSSSDSSKSYPHCETNQRSSDQFHLESRTLNVCDKEVNSSVLSNSGASHLSNHNLSLLSNSVKSECSEEQSFLKTENFLDCDYSNLVSISTVDVSVKSEAPGHPDDSVDHDIESKPDLCESKLGDSVLLSASTMEKKLSDFVHLQPVSLSATGLSLIKTEECLVKEISDKTENDKSYDKYHEAQSMSAPQGNHSASTSFENLLEKPYVKSEIRHTDFSETNNKFLEVKYESEEENFKCSSTYCEESGDVKSEYDEQLVTDISTISKPVDCKHEMLPLACTDSCDVKQEVDTGNKSQHDLKPKKSFIMIDEVRDECPLGHFLIPADATFNIRTGRITVPCQSCKTLVYMKSSIDFV